LPVVAIVGVGLIGGSIGLALRERGLARRVIGVARREETVRAAMERGAIDEGTLDAREGVASADLVVLCTPVLTIPPLAERIAERLWPGTIVTDVGSTKEYLSREVSRRLPPGCPFVGGHPMAGSEKGGVEAARADLFEGATWVLCPGELDPLARLASWVLALGARPICMEAEAHDRVVAAISHLPHVAAAALVNAVVAGGEERDVLRTFIAGGFTSTSRIASSPPELWRDICLTNRESVLATLGHFRAALARFEEALRREDAAGLLAAFADAREAREELIR
jgi:prephenate dehydrogenase